MPPIVRSSRPKAAVILLAGAAVVALAALPLRSADESLDYRPVAYAIKGATIVVAPGKTIEGGTVVVRKGVIEAVGPADATAVPFDAEVIDGKGLTVYAGFVDLYTTLGQPAGVTRSKVGAGRTAKSSEYAMPRTPADNRNGLTPEFEVAGVLDLPDSLGEERHKLGFTSLVAAPGGSIVTGQSAVASLSGLPRREAIVKAPLALHIRLAPPSEPPPPPNPNEPPAVATRRFRSTGAIAYPVALMGVVAHLRQAMLDAEYADGLATLGDTKGSVLPPFDPSLKALQAARTKTLPVWWEANTRDEIHRALDLAEEFGTTAVIVGGREAGKVVDRLKAKGVPVVLRLDFPDEPKVPTADAYRAKSEADRDESLGILADRASRWKERAGTAAALAKAGVSFAFATDGVAKAETFPAQVRKAIGAGLSKDAALDALTRKAAEIAGLDKRLGTIEVGKLGHLVAMTAPFTDDKAKVRYVLADGIKFDMDKPGQPAAKAKGKARPPGEEADDEPKPADDSKKAPKAETPEDQGTPKPAPADTPKADAKKDAPKPDAKDKSKPDAEKLEDKDSVTTNQYTQTLAQLTDVQVRIVEGEARLQLLQDGAAAPQAPDTAAPGDHELARMFYAEPAVAEVKARLEKAAQQLKQVSQVTRDPNDPSRRAPQKTKRDAQKQLDQLWIDLSPALAAKIRAAGRAPGGPTGEIRQAEIQLTTLKAQEASLSKKLERLDVRQKNEGNAKSPEDQGTPKPAPADTPKPDAKKDAPKPDAKKKDETPKSPFVDELAEFDADRRPTLKTGGTVFLKDAVILTVTKGTIPKGSILIKDGKIAAVGPDLKAPEGVQVIDAAGLVAMPGIIDTHSHMAIAGGVNEMSLSIVPEVRVKDVVTGDDETIYRAAAGGTTSARLLHGSANTIGGQDAVIKLKYGLPGRDLIVKGGPQGVKFALGENVTRRTGRFPNTRMGVESVIERAFDEALAYKADWARYAASKARGEAVPPPRRDLRLEALAGILDGSIKIHSHCYRNDEILMLLRVATKYGVKVRSLQHVLEGYKVAAEIAAHGASASTFSDWWAYKVEAFDAIPHNAALLTQAGASVCIKSDSEELVRHLYLEAAKMVKYGGSTEAQALAMITINPARELGLDARLGSIEVGKDADIALFNAHPFDGFARCELTLIDGEVHFQRKTADGKPAKPRAGDHAAMPTSAAKTKVLDFTPSPSGKYVIQGATVHPVSGPAIEGGQILIEGGKIVAVGTVLNIDPDVKIVDAKGLHAWPGLFDSGSQVGLYEVGSLAETQDTNDSAQFQPELRASTAVHPDSELIPVTRANGILSAFVQPGGGVIAGQGAVIGLDGWVPADMVIKDGAGLIVNIPPYVRPDPDNPRRRGFGPFGPGGPDADPNARRKETLEAIKDRFRTALAYDAVRTSALAAKAPAPTPDPRLSALVPFAKGEKPVLFAANQKMQILDAIALTRDLKLKGVIVGGFDAWKVAPALKAAGMPVIVGGTMHTPPSATDPYDSPYANPARLFEAGVPFAIASNVTGDQGTSSRNLPFEAAMAVAYGLPEDEALKALTIAPAKILGVDAQIGTLDQGKRADVVLTAGHILQPTTEVKGLFIAGKPVPPESRHTRLYEKFKRRLAEVKAGTAKPGVESSDPGPSKQPKPATPVGSAAGGR